MRIAILGATSQIAKDLVLSFSEYQSDDLVLFGRRPEVLARWLEQVGLADCYEVNHYENIKNPQPFDALINFVGVGDPARAIEMGSSILDITAKFDDIALDYLQNHPDCRYLFLSSGAVYDSNFDVPADGNTPISIAINELQAHDWYASSKLRAESRHRALQEFSIVDIRVFNYFSHTQDMSARFLITDIARAIREKNLFSTSADKLVRDFLHPSDFAQLIFRILASPKTNCVIDCYSKAPVDKSTLLKALQEAFNLQYQIVAGGFGTNATGKKPLYYSLNRKASEFSYQPQYSSLDGVCKELDLYLRGAGKVTASDA